MTINVFLSKASNAYRRHRDIKNHRFSVTANDHVDSALLWRKKNLNKTPTNFRVTMQRYVGLS